MRFAAVLVQCMCMQLCLEIVVGLGHSKKHDSYGGATFDEHLWLACVDRP